MTTTDLTLRTDLHGMSAGDDLLITDLLMTGSTIADHLLATLERAAD